MYIVMELPDCSKHAYLMAGYLTLIHVTNFKKKLLIMIIHNFSNMMFKKIHLKTFNRICCVFVNELWADGWGWGLCR